MDPALQAILQKLILNQKQKSRDSNLAAKAASDQQFDHQGPKSAPSKEASQIGLKKVLEFIKKNGG